MSVRRELVIKAGLFVVVFFAMSQLVRLGGNLIVTRLLTPDIFGVTSIVVVFIYGLTMFSNLGLLEAIVKNHSEDRPVYADTVWTMQIIRGWFLFFITIITSGLLFLAQNLSNGLPGVYSNSTLPMLLLLAAFTPLFMGYQTLAPAIMGREFKRGRVEFIEFIAQTCGVLVMIVWALISPSMWALVSAGFTSSLVSLILMYKLFDIRHKIAWDRDIAKEVYNFGKWIIVASSLTFIAQQGDKLFFSINISPTQLGIYNIAFMLSAALHIVIEKLSANVWYPAFCKKNNSKDQLRKFYYKVRTIYDGSCLVAGITLLLFSPKIISFLYDSRYHDAGWMLQILSISIIGVSMSSLAKVCLMSLGITKVHTYVMLIRSVALLIFLPVLYTLFGIKGAILAVATNTFFAIPVQTYWLFKERIYNAKREMLMLTIIVTLFAFAFLKTGFI